MASLLNSICNNNRGGFSPSNLFMVAIQFCAFAGLFFLCRYLWPAVSGWWFISFLFGAWGLFWIIVISILEYKEGKKEQ
jgi:hypothetical protein